MSDLPKKIDRFMVLSLLGEGAMAKVYKVFDPNTNREIALKLLKSSFANDKDYKRRFMNEAMAAGNVCDHINIATIYDVSSFEGAPYITMEYAGINNLEKNASQKNLSLESILLISKQIAKALAYSHRNNVVHCDIKPSNIICGDGVSSNYIRVTDFGIADVVNKLKSEDDSADDDLLMGSPHYMSPEQIKGETIDGRSDLFSLGVLLYELCTKRKPFSGDDLQSLSDNICDANHTPITDADGLPFNLANIINRCLEKTPDKRFETARALADALERVEQDVVEEKENKAKRFHSFRWKWVAIMALVLSLISSIGIYFINENQHKSMEELSIDYGTSFANFLAQKSIESLLLIDDDEAFELANFVNKIKLKSSFSYIIITDKNGIVRGTTKENLLGTPYSISTDSKLLKTVDDVQVYENISPTGDGTLDMEMPIMVQNLTIGTVFLGVSKDATNRALKFTLVGLIIFMLIVMIASLLVVTIFAQSIKFPLTTLKRAMLSINQSNMGYRLPIDNSKNDEFTEVFDGFNKMMNELESNNASASLKKILKSENNNSKPKETKISNNDSLKDDLVHQPAKASASPMNDDKTRIIPRKKIKSNNKKL